MSIRYIAEQLEAAPAQADAVSRKYYPEPTDFASRNAIAVGYLTGAIKGAVEGMRSLTARGTESGMTELDLALSQQGVV